jgi:DNA-binding transcriptional LysR family regulator
MEPTITLHKLQVLREVVKAQSLTVAAQSFSVTQPVISDHIKDLEHYFGAKLLYQQGRRMLLTEAGSVVHDWAVEVLRSAENARGIVRLISSADAGSAAVGASETPGGYMLADRLTQFKLCHPAAKVSLDVGAAYEVWEQTKSGVFDFAIVAGPEPPVALHTDIFCVEPIVVVAGPGHPLAQRDMLDLADLCDASFVSISRRAAHDDRLHSLGIDKPNIILRVGNDEGLKQAVGAGLGIAVAFRCCVARELATGALRELKVCGFAETRPFYLIYSPRKRFSPLQLELIDFLRRGAQSANSEGNKPLGGAARDGHSAVLASSGASGAVGS